MDSEISDIRIIPIVKGRVVENDDRLEYFKRISNGAEVLESEKIELVNKTIIIE